MRPMCVSCKARAVKRRGVCTACEQAIRDGIMEDVRLPAKPVGRPRTQAPRWTGAEFTARFFSAEAVERRIAHTTARERARSSR